MREVYLEHRSVESVARLCGVSWDTAEKYRVNDKWDDAAARVDKLAEDIAVKKIGRRRADTIRIAHAAIVKMAKDLESKDKIDWSAQDLDRMARLIELLTGGADSRPGIADRIERLAAEIKMLGTEEHEELANSLAGTDQGSDSQPEAPDD